MKRRYSMIKKYFVKSTLGFTLAGLLLGCSNLFTNAGEANSTYTKNNDEKVNCVITGSISTGAAMPSSLVPGLNNGNGEARSAFASLPNFTDDDISIEITATGISSAGNILGPVNGTATASTSSYAISISDAGTWTITAKMFKGTGENKKPIMQKTIDGINIDATNYRVNKNIELEVVDINDNGSIKLEIVDETGKVNKVLWQDKSCKITNGNQRGATFSDGKAIIDETSVASGSYSLYLEFENIVGNNHSTIFKVNNEAINVFANLTTDTWVKNGDEIYLQDNGDGTAKFVITDECLQSYTMKDFYVDAAKGNDSYKGSSYRPFKTLDKAVETVAFSSNSGPFTIHLADGEYELNERNYISPKKSLTICGESRDGTKIIDKLDSTVSFIANYLGVDQGVSKIEIYHLTYVNDRSANGIANNLFDTSEETGQPIELRFGDVNFKTNGTISVTDEDHTRSIISIKNTDSLFIHDCLFSDISLEYTGPCNGAIINAPGGSSVAIQNTNFTNCKITSNYSGSEIKGGLIYSGGELTLKNVDFTKDASGNKNEIAANDNGIAGGLIYSDGSKFDFADCIFADTKMTAKEDEEITGAVYCKPEVPPSEYKYGNCKTYNIETSGTTNVKGVGLYFCPPSSGSLGVEFSGTTWFDEDSTIYLDEVPYGGASGITWYGYISIKSDLTPQNQDNQPVDYVATIAPKDNDYNYTIGKKILSETQQSSTTYQYTLVPANYQKFKLLSAPGSDCDYKLVVDSNVAKVASALSTPSSFSNSQNLATWLENSNNKKIGVETKEDFEALTDLSNQSFEGKTIKLVNDIELDGGFTPFGSAEDAPFKGMIDGNGKTITYNQSTELIKYANGCTVKNLTVEGNIREITSETNRGSLIQNASGDITLDKCVNKVNAEDSEQYNLSGFIFSYTGSGNVTITNCSNEGTLKVIAGVKVGGMIGSLDRPNGSSNPTVLIKNCSNSGGLINKSSGSDSPTFGGIIGSANNSSLFIDSCSNTAETINYANTCGGIVGYIYLGSVTIINSYNTTNFVTSTSLTNGMWGGIIGNISSSDNNLPEEVKVINCYNTGNIDGDGTDYVKYKGGIIGRATHGTCKNCVNTGHISDYSGGDENFHYYGGCIGQYSSANCVFEYLFTNENSIGTNYVLGETPNSGSITSYSISGTTPTVSSAIGGNINLIDILNAWINAQDKPEDYFSWTTNSNGDPVLVIPTN